MTGILNEVWVQNVDKNYIEIEDFISQLETGTENWIPHYQLTIKVSALCTRKKVLETLEKRMERHPSVDIQFNL